MVKTKKTYRKKVKAVTKAEVTKMMKGKDPNSLPSWKLIFGGHFKQPIHRTTCNFSVSGTSSNQTIIQSTPAAIAGTPVPSFGAIAFNLTGVDLLVPAYNQLYDQYRIVGVELTFSPMFNVDQAAGPNNWLGDFYSCVDYDDSVVPSTIQYIRSYENVKESNTMKKHTHKFTPHIATAAYSGAFASYANQAGQWIDLGSSTVLHYGVKYAFSGGASTATVAAYSIECKMMIEFKNVR